VSVGATPSGAVPIPSDRPSVALVAAGPYDAWRVWNHEQIVGRERELESIARFLEAVPNGSAALVIEGEAGIGKTTLWQAGVDLAGTLGLRVLSTRAGQSEARLSFTALGDLLEPVVDEWLPTLPDPQRTALEVALLRARSTGPAPDPRAVSLAALAVLRSAATSDPLPSPPTTCSGWMRPRRDCWSSAFEGFGGAGRPARLRAYRRFRARHPAAGPSAAARPRPPLERRSRAGR
jgi:hypothetical protein